MPFTGADIADAREWTKHPWFQDGYAWATDGRILVRAAVIPNRPRIGADPPDCSPPDPAWLKGWRGAMQLLQDETNPNNPWEKAQFPPCGLPEPPINSAGCFSCGRPWDKPRRPATNQPVALNRGRNFFDAYYLRLLHALPIELDFFVREPEQSAYFTDARADFIGILMPLRLSVNQAGDAIQKQWGAES